MATVTLWMKPHSRRWWVCCGECPTQSRWVAKGCFFGASLGGHLLEAVVGREQKHFTRLPCDFRVSTACLPRACYRYRILFAASFFCFGPPFALVELFYLLCLTPLLLVVALCLRMCDVVSADASCADIFSKLVRPIDEDEHAIAATLWDIVPDLARLFVCCPRKPRAAGVHLLMAAYATVLLFASPVLLLGTFGLWLLPQTYSKEAHLLCIGAAALPLETIFAGAAEAGCFPVLCTRFLSTTEVPSPAASLRFPT